MQTPPVHYESEIIHPSDTINLIKTLGCLPITLRTKITIWRSPCPAQAKLELILSITFSDLRDFSVMQHLFLLFVYL